MGKNDKAALGRALVKHHNQMVQQSKEKGRFYRNQQRKVLESITDVNDIDAVIEQADEAARLFSADNPVPNLLVDPPPWNAKMTVEELDANETRAFLVWRRNLASLEENEKLVLTPFEKNLDIWRQLWRVVERSDLLVMVVDARDPLFYRCPDLEDYAREIDEHRRTLLLVNKADLLPYAVREKWAKYFHLHGILFVFWSAKAATAALEGKMLGFPTEKQNGLQESDDTKIYGREELLARLQSEAEEIAMTRRKHSPSVNISGNASKSVVVGFVGYPNVGKSSTINALVGEKRTGVTSTPGKTKHFQTLIISDELTLCDCPGLVFPSFTSSRYEMIASGVLPIDRMTEHREAIQVVANRVPRHAIEDVYKITLPKPKSYEPQSRSPLGSELLRAYCASRGYVASSGLPDETKAARIILKDYIDGKLPHFEMPPGTSDEEPISSGLRESDSSDCEDDGNSEDESGPTLEHVLTDLNSFDVANGLGLEKVAPVKKKPANASHKQHRKPQRKKDRSWRVHGDGDGMPVVRVFQKPLNTGPLKVG
ncbi:hypothetical protein RHMOL_Rhmol13G0264200 [Rhododendron molle]|uniref:Uncharacterized protein n=1 Tax=Rhododendron molle TaxID=49168 RepID=A0ACC0LAW7_RHOML|nr:hypothetical protein RHMOL_Rhmol13G0264200 [Rhododendron molle]